MRKFRFLAAALLFTGAATPGWACRVGGDQVLFDSLPRTLPSQVKAIHVRFANYGSAVDRWQRVAPATAGGDLIGVIRTNDGGSIPVYHPVTSCTHGFFGKRPTPLDRQTYLVGRYVRTAGKARAFYAAGDWNGRWVNVR